MRPSIQRAEPLDGTSKQGTIYTSAQVIESVLGLAPERCDDEKVTMEWHLTIDGAYVFIWDWCGSARSEQFSCYDPQHKLTQFFRVQYR